MKNYKSPSITLVSESVKIHIITAGIRFINGLPYEEMHDCEQLF